MKIFLQTYNIFWGKLISVWQQLFNFTVNEDFINVLFNISLPYFHEKLSVLVAADLCLLCFLFRGNQLLMCKIQR